MLQFAFDEEMEDCLRVPKTHSPQRGPVYVSTLYKPQRVLECMDVQTTHQTLLKMFDNDKENVPDFYTISDALQGNAQLAKAKGFIFYNAKPRGSKRVKRLNHPYSLWPSRRPSPPPTHKVARELQST